MKFKINDKIKLALKIIFVSIVFIFVFREFIIFFKSFNVREFIIFKDRLTVLNLAIIVILGLICFSPLSFYDFIIRKRINIKLSKRKLYKYSWIASSISSILGFGGAAAVAIKQNFYGEYVDDKKSLLKEVSKVVAFNVAGLSLVSLIYTIFKFQAVMNTGMIKYAILLIDLYFPGLLIYETYINIIREKDKKEYYASLSIMGVAILDWLGNMILIYSILYILGGKISFIQFFPTYVTSVVIGTLSLIPGGLGSFDLVFIAGMANMGIPTELSFLVTILYRVTYFIIPAIIGILLYFRDFGKKLNIKFNNVPSQLSSLVANKVLMVLVFISGFVLLLSEAPNSSDYKIKLLNEIVHESFFNIGNQSTLIIAFILISLSVLLTYKTKTIYRITIVVLVFGALLSLYRDPGISELIYLLFVALLIYVSRRMYYRKSFVLNVKTTARNVLLLVIGLVTYLGLVGYSVRGRHITFIKLITENKFYDNGIIAFVVAIVILIIVFFLTRDKKMKTNTLSETEEDINNILKTYGGILTAHLVFLGDKYVYINEKKDVILQYDIFSENVFVLGDPIGNEESFSEAIEEFYDYVDLYGYDLIFYEATDEMVSLLHDKGYIFLKLGEEAVVDIQNFDLAGKKRQKLRTSMNKVSKEGYTFEVLNPPFSKEIMSELKVISDAWLDERSEKGYSMGYYDEVYLNRAPIAIVRDGEGEIKAFASVMEAYDNKKTIAIDLMRYVKETPHGLMDFVFVNLILDSKEKGYKYFQMGMAPLSNVGNSKYAFYGEKFAQQIYTYGQFLYSFKGLRKYKEKFASQWDPKYLAYRRKSALSVVSIQATLLCSKSRKKEDSIIYKITKSMT
ncbi:MAG: bifunctional lysylphosphatidylglycerol flippase/synthetase MprF [Sarcina sp.]